MIRVGMLIALAGEGLLLAAVWAKGGGTTSDPLKLCWPFLPFVLLAIATGVTGPRRDGWFMLLAASALGFLLPSYLVVTGTLVDYEDAIVDQETEISDFPHRWLLGDAAASLLVMAGAWWMDRRARPPDAPSLQPTDPSRG